MKARSEGLGLRHCDVDGLQEDTKPVGYRALTFMPDGWSVVAVGRQPIDVLSGPHEQNWADRQDGVSREAPSNQHGVD